MDLHVCIEMPIGLVTYRFDGDEAQNLPNLRDIVSTLTVYESKDNTSRHLK